MRGDDQRARRVGAGTDRGWPIRPAACRYAQRLCRLDHGSDMAAVHCQVGHTERFCQMVSVGRRLHACRVNRVSVVWKIRAAGSAACSHSGYVATTRPRRRSTLFKSTSRQKVCSRHRWRSHLTCPLSWNGLSTAWHLSPRDEPPRISVTADQVLVEPITTVEQHGRRSGPPG